MSSALERECVHQTVWDSLQNAKEEQTRLYKYSIRGDLNTLQFFFFVDLLQTYIVSKTKWSLLKFTMSAVEQKNQPSLPDIQIYFALIHCFLNCVHGFKSWQAWL